MSTPEPPDGPGEGDRPVPASGGPEQPTARSAAQPAAPRGSRWTPRRRWLAAGAGVLVLVVVGAALFGVARHRGGPGYWDEGHWGDRHGGPDRTAFRGGFDEDGLGMGGPMGLDGPDLGFDGPGAGPGAGPGGPGGPGDGPGRHRGPGGPRGLANTAAVTGSVVSVGEGNLVVAVDGAGQQTIPTTERTRVRGGGNGLTGLQAGQRVVVRVGGDKSAVAVFLPVARATGTIIALDGDRATLVRPDGLTDVVDVTGVADANPKPAVGDLVVVRGAPADNGGVLKADQLRVLLRAS